MRSLFEISEDLHFLEDFLTDAGGDVTDEQLEAEIDKWLGDLGEERDRKIDNYCALYKEFEARAEARKVEAARISELGQIDNNAAARLKARLFNFFTSHGIEKIETPRFRVSVSNNGGALPVFLNPAYSEAPELLPEEYRRVVTTPNMGAIQDALKSGKELSFAAFGERGKHLRIK